MAVVFCCCSSSSKWRHLIYASFKGDSQLILQRLADHSRSKARVDVGVSGAADVDHQRLPLQLVRFALQRMVSTSAARVM